MSRGKQLHDWWEAVTERILLTSTGFEVSSLYRSPASFGRALTLEARVRRVQRPSSWASHAGRAVGAGL